MLTQSAKAKGRRLQQWVRDLLLEASDLEEDDIKSTSMGASGEDIQLSPKAREVYPFSIECKNSERISIWKAYSQAESNAKGHQPLLIIKRNNHRPLVVMDAETFIRRLK